MAIINGQDEFSTLNLLGINPSCNEQFLFGIITGGVCRNEEIITISDVIIGSFTVPTRTIRAFVQVETDEPAADPNRVILYTQCLGLTPSLIPLVGTFQSQFGAFEIGGGINMANFQAIGVAAATSVRLHVTYFG